MSTARAAYETYYSATIDPADVAHVADEIDLEAYRALEAEIDKLVDLHSKAVAIALRLAPLDLPGLIEKLQLLCEQSHLATDYSEGDGGGPLKISVADAKLLVPA